MTCVGWRNTMVYAMCKHQIESKDSSYRDTIHRFNSFCVVPPLTADEVEHVIKNVERKLRVGPFSEIDRVGHAFTGSEFFCFFFLSHPSSPSPPPPPPPPPVNHPAHYGGEDDPYEAIKVIEAWGLGFNLGNCTKYVARAGKKGGRLEDLKKAAWYLNREIARG
jgi:Protein of unknwon function (DUF3310)